MDRITQKSSSVSDSAAALRPKPRTETLQRNASQLSEIKIIRETDVLKKLQAMRPKELVLTLLNDEVMKTPGINHGTEINVIELQ